MVAFVMNVSGQPLALYLGRGVVFQQTLSNPKHSRGICQRQNLRLKHIPRADGEIQQLRFASGTSSPSNRRDFEHWTVEILRVYLEKITSSDPKEILTRDANLASWPCPGVAQPWKSFRAAL